jgi:glycosyltransferase involved in cell wall biosynthesis
MKISVIIPVYNEESTIAEVIRKVLLVDINKEIIVVDDGSTDNTSEIVDDLKKRNVELTTVHHSMVNLGKGLAIRIGLKYAKGDVVIIQDADLELDPHEYYQLVEPIRKGEADVVFGSRFLRKNPNIPFRSRFANFFLTGFANLLYGLRITDEATAYKVFKTDVIKSINLQCRGFEFCPEVVAKLAKSGTRIAEVPIAFNPRSKTEGKKLHYFRDGIKAIWTLVKHKFVD